MDDVAALRRTIRRCTAVLLIAIGFVVLNGDEYTDVSEWGLWIVGGAGLYLLLSAFAGFATRSGQGERDHGGPGNGDKSDGSNDGDGTGGDGDGAADDEGEDGPRPPTGPVSGPW